MPKVTTPARPHGVYIRGLVPAIEKAFRRRAEERHMTLADYLTELVGLHEDMRALVEEVGDRRVRAVLSKRGLETVRA